MQIVTKVTKRNLHCEIAKVKILRCLISEDTNTGPTQYEYQLSMVTLAVQHARTLYCRTGIQGGCSSFDTLFTSRKSFCEKLFVSV